MELKCLTKAYIKAYCENFYKHAIKRGFKLSDVEHIGCHLYEVSLGNAKITFMGTADGSAKPIGIEGDII